MAHGLRRLGFTQQEASPNHKSFSELSAGAGLECKVRPKGLGLRALNPSALICLA